MGHKPWIRYCLYEQAMQCQICGQLETLMGAGPVSRFLAEVSAFARSHAHRELTARARLQAMRPWSGFLSPD